MFQTTSSFVTPSGRPRAFPPRCATCPRDRGPPPWRSAARCRSPGSGDFGGDFLTYYGKSPFLMGKSPFLIWIDGDLPSGND